MKQDERGGSTRDTESHVSLLLVYHITGCKTVTFLISVMCDGDHG
jgi:hypothetical protein